MAKTEPEDLPFRPCVGVMLINADGRIFAGQRKDSPVPAWQMPQGGIDGDEKPHAAALRELREETGITGDLVEFVAKSPDWVTYDLPDELGRQDLGRQVSRPATALVPLPLSRPRRPDRHRRPNIPEFSEWRWVTADEMLAAIVPFKRAVYDEVVVAFQDWLA